MCLQQKNSFFFSFFFLPYLKLDVYLLNEQSRALDYGGCNNMLLNAESLSE